jgi:small subunit ribosomal protein S15
MGLNKSEIIKEFALNPKDTGSADVQIALLSSRIANLTQHMIKNPKDLHSRRGLLLMLGRRKRLLKYLARTNPERYSKLIAKVGLKK